MHDLPPNPYLDIFPSVALHHMPVSVCHTIAYLVLGHQLQRCGPHETDEDSTQERSRLYHHRGEAMRCMSADIANATTQCSDATILSVLMFLFADVSVVIPVCVFHPRYSLSVYRCASSPLPTGGTISLAPRSSFFSGAACGS